MSQRADVLKMLRAAGGRGVHTFELRQAFIGNPSQRIADLEAEGHVIKHTREKLHGKATGSRYVLLSTTSGPSPDVALSSSTAAGDGPGALFEIGQAQQSAVYDPDWSDAA